MRSICIPKGLYLPLKANDFSDSEEPQQISTCRMKHFKNESEKATYQGRGGAESGE